MQTLFDWAIRYNYSVPGEPRVQCISKREMCCMCFFIDCQANISEGRNRGMNVQFMLSKKRGQDVMNFTPTKQHQKCIYVAVLHIAELVTLARFAFYLNAFQHLAMDVTPACERCRTSIWNVLWRNPISGFNGSSEAAHPGSCEIYARAKLVYSINFPIFNYWHYCLCVLLFCTTCKTSFGSIKADNN